MSTSSDTPGRHGGDLGARYDRLAARISRAADAPIEVRQRMDAPPDDVMEQIST